MKMNSFGLDIGSTAMKAVWLSHEKDVYSLSSCISMPVPMKGMVSDSPIDQEQMAQSIINMLNEGKIAPRDVHIALADNQVYSKVIDMPVLSDKELESAIYWEAEQYIPAPLQTIVLDWKVLRRDIKIDGLVKMQVLLVGAPIALIKKYQKILNMAGLNILSVETEVLSVIRSLTMQGYNATFLLLDIGNVNTSLAIVQNGIPIFTYAIPVGGIAINRIIAAEFNFSLDQAEEYKRAYGMSDATLGGKISKAIEPILQSILEEVKKALAFFNEKYKNESVVTQTILVGGTAKLPGLDIFLVKNLGFETIVANPWKSLNIANVPPPLLDHGADFAVAIGLALKGT